MPFSFLLRCGNTLEIWKLLLQALPRWKLENTPPPEEKKQPSTEGKKKDDKDKERKSTKSDKGQAQSEKADRDNKSKDKDKDKGIGSVGLICTARKTCAHSLTTAYGLLTEREVIR